MNNDMMDGSMSIWMDELMIGVIIVSSPWSYGNVDNFKMVPILSPIRMHMEMTIRNIIYIYLCTVCLFFTFSYLWKTHVIIFPQKKN